MSQSDLEIVLLDHAASLLFLVTVLVGHCAVWLDVFTVVLLDCSTLSLVTTMTLLLPTVDSPDCLLNVLLYTVVQSLYSVSLLECSM